MPRYLSIITTAWLYLTLLFCTTAKPVQSPLKLPKLDLLQTSIKEIQHLLVSGEMTSVMLVRMYLDRIERDNLSGMGLRAVIQTAPSETVLRIASELDDEISRGEIRGDLHGIPILVKDNIATHPELGMDTTAGSLALEGSIVPGDALVIDKLRRAGAIVIAKTNLNELAGWKGVLKAFHPLNPSSTSQGEPPRFRAPTNGWSAVGGQCSSAYVEGGFEYGGNPLGSSSGSAVGLSVGWGVVSLGTDTLGSVLGPANRAALYAVRPTLGRISRRGVVPVSLDHDTVGSMGFTTYDVALMLEIMIGEDIDDKSTHDIPPLLNLTSLAQDPPPLSSFTLGIPTRYFTDHPILEIPSGCPAESKDQFDLTIHHLQEQHGVNVVWGTNINMTSSTDIDQFLEVLTDKVNIDFKADMDGYLGEYLQGSKVKSMLDLAMFNDKYSCCQERLLTSLLSPPRDSSSHRALSSRLEELANTQSLGYIFDNHPEIDAIAFEFERGEPALWVGAANYPAGVVPLGYCSNGLPFGLMFVTRRFEEDKLISLMAAYEKVMPRRKVPQPYTDRYGSYSS